MGFFDLNIPYLESDKHTADNSTKKSTRLKLIIKAMELGYTGIAYNRSIKGVMSESDRCSLSLFPLSSILKLSPSLSSTVNFHRNLLDIPISSPFRQYTRLTVIVDSSSQASALNSGNPILKSYDIVAVRPLNQSAFEHACQASEVDLIAIDFSEKLPFRLKQPLVKAAVERGVYFEITYSSLIMDAQLRRQMISSAKLLVNWTRGKNLIFSSAVPSVTDLRGPYDVANLLTLLGLSMERAKAAISKNCRSLIANALRKKQFYKEAIRVEVISSTAQCDSKEPGFDDWLKWDPISSGEGDLLLDEMAKSFSASNKASNDVKAIDFTSVVESLQPHGLQIKDMVSVTKPALEPPHHGNSSSSAQETVVPFAVYGASEKVDRLNLLHEEYLTSLDDTPAKDQTFSRAGSKILSADTLKVFSKFEKGVSHATSTDKQTKVSNGLDALLANHESEVDGFQLQSYMSICGTHVSLPTDTPKGFTNAEEANKIEEYPSSLDVCLANREAEVHNLQPQSGMPIWETCLISLDDATIVHSPRKDTEIAHACNSAAAAATETVTMSKYYNSSAFPNEEGKRSNSSDVVLAIPDVVMNTISIETDVESNAVAVVETVTLSKDHSSSFMNEECRRSNSLDLVLDTPDVVLDEMSTQMDIKHISKSEQFRETGGDSVILSDGSSVLESDNMLVNNTDSAIASYEPIADVTMEDKKQAENQFGMKYPTLEKSVSGRDRVKRRTSHHARLFPFKRLWNPVSFKKKSWKFKNKSISR